MANLTFVNGTMTIYTKNKRDAANFIYLINKYLANVTYNTVIPDFQNMKRKEILEELEELDLTDYDHGLDIDTINCKQYSVRFYGTGRWSYTTNIENMETWLRESITSKNSSCKTLDDIISNGLKIVFDYIEEDESMSSIFEYVNIADFEKGKINSEISSKSHDWTIENLEYYCDYQDCFDLTHDGLLKLVTAMIDYNTFNKEELKSCQNFDRLLDNWDHHYKEMFSKFIKKFDISEIFFDYDIDAVESNEDINICFREELENYIANIVA